MTSVNLNGIFQLDLNFEGTTTASLSAPSTLQVNNTLPIATVASTGVVKPDGTTITILPDGTISATNTATIGATPTIKSGVVNTVYQVTDTTQVSLICELTLGVGSTGTVGIWYSANSSLTPSFFKAQSIDNSSGWCSLDAIVPAGWYYRVNNTGIGTGDNVPLPITYWIETTLTS